MVTFVWGPPCSGKSTYIAEHASTSATVVDFDRLAGALSHPHADEHEPAWLARECAFAARRAAISDAMRHSDLEVWIVDSAATEAKLDEYRRSGYAVVVLHVERDECLRRATSPGRRQAVEEWFARHRPSVPSASTSRAW